MDEFPEFSRRALEVLRQPLEDGVVTISRARAALTFPARFMLVAAQNPCPCGFYGDPQRSCSCAPGARQRYRERLSGPLLDRIDLRLSVPRLAPEELLRAPPGEPSARVRERVVAARTRALERQGVPNAELGGAALRRHAALGASAVAFAQTLAKQLGLSGRGFDRLLRVARTVADLAGASQLEEAHLAEAAAYRA
jgi:magnesium chelatase family protein